MNHPKPLPKHLPPLRAILFDIDGVILESMDIKTEAFMRLFHEYPEHLDRIRDLHVQNGGTSRYIKFRMIYRDILKQPLSEERFQFLCERYSALVFEAMVACPFVSGAREFLETYFGKCLFYVITGTPQEEIEFILKKRGLDSFFSGVFGYPPSKEKSIKSILERGGYKPEDVILIGDALADFKGAEANGVPFVARVSPKAFNPFEGLAVDHVVENLFQFEELIRERIPS